MASVTSCQVDEIETPAEELYAREFIKNFGLVDPDHNWSVAKQGTVTVSPASATDVKIYAIVDGKTLLVGDYADVTGTHTLTFDVPQSVEKVLVKTDGFFEEVALGSTIDIAAASKASRGITGNDNLPNTIKNGFYRGFKFVEAFNSVLPEYDSDNHQNKDAMANTKVSTDFSFVSTGKPFVFYPIYWNTGAKNTLGVWWYENGELKTKDLFNNYDLDENGGQVTNNMYRKATQTVPDIAMDSHIPADKSTDVDLSGQIKITFNCDIKFTQIGRATLRLASNPTGSQAFLKKIEASGREAIFTYEGLSPNTEYIFNIPARRFVPASEPDNTTNYSKEYSFSFTTVDTNLKLTKLSPADDKTTTNRTNGKNGTVVMTYNQNIQKASDELPTMKSIDGTHSATVTLKSITDNVLTYEYKDAQYDQVYQFTVPQGVVCSTEDANAKSNLREFRFVTMVDPNEYTYSETCNNIIISKQSYKENDNIAAETAPISITVFNDVTCKHMKTKEEWPFTFNSSSFTCSNAIDIKANNKNEASEKEPFAGGPASSSNNQRAIITVVPSQDMRFTAHCRIGSGNEPIMFDRSAYRNIHSKGVGDGVDGNYLYRSFSFDIKKGRSYTLYSLSSMHVAAFSYQTVESVIEKDEPIYDPTETIISTGSKSRSRAGESDTPDYSTPTYNSEQEIIDAGYTKIAYPTQSSSYIDYKEGNGGKDDVVTHQISVTLPAGRVFGFYIRNNSGAQNITYTDLNNPVAHTNYSMSSLNKEMENSFFNLLLLSTTAAPHYTEGWTKYDKITHDVPDGRKYSVGATYSVDIDGENYRYFSFEDWIDCDFNDIVFLVDPESADDTPIVDLEVDTNPYLFAVEDLGAISTSDIDFNDIVFGVEHVAGHEHAFVTMLAAGGTLEAQLLYDGKVVGKEIGEIMAGPGKGKTLNHVNDWFGESSHNFTINVGSGGKNPGFGNLTTVKIKLTDPNMTIAPGHESGMTGIVDNLSGFSVRVKRDDGEYTTISKPNSEVNVPQIIVVPASWNWPRESVAISDAYPGGVSAKGDRIASFKQWVSDRYKDNWYTEGVSTHVMSHPWEGSDAAREYVRSQTNN